jgi:hypothetical protein
MLIVYKVGYEHYHDGWREPKRLVIELLIPEEAKTNIHRKKNIKFPSTASYRTNIVFVNKIYDPETKNEYYHAESMYSVNYTGQLFMYVKNRWIEESFDSDLDNVCSKGIHFFLYKEIAEQFALIKKENGTMDQYEPEQRLKMVDRSIL